MLTKKIIHYIHPYELQSQRKRKGYQNSEHRMERNRAEVLFVFQFDFIL